VGVPEDVFCCGFAGDRGFSHPELNAAALAQLGEQVRGCTVGYSTSRTCEVGLSLHAGLPYKNLMFLLDAASWPKGGARIPVTRRGRFCQRWRCHQGTTPTRNTNEGRTMAHCRDRRAALLAWALPGAAADKQATCKDVYQNLPSCYDAVKQMDLEAASTWSRPWAPAHGEEGLTGFSAALSVGMCQARLRGRGEQEGRHEA
jgi:hypothetical protein